MDKFTEKIVENMIVNKIVEQNDREIYEFGINQGITLLMNIVTTLGIGLFAGMFWESALFLAFYTPIRIYAGGYHAKTQVRCYIFSVFIVVAALFLIRVTQYLEILSGVMVVLSAITILLFSPIENRAKPLSVSEKQEYGKRTRLVLAGEFLIFIILHIMNRQPILGVGSVAVFAAAVMVIGGTIENIISAKS